MKCQTSATPQECLEVLNQIRKQKPLERMVKRAVDPKTRKTVYQISCINCGNLFYATKSSIKFCSKGCRHHGIFNHQWSGGSRKTNKGYIELYLPTHPNQCKNYFSEHRFNVELSIGRFLDTREVVHHINEIRNDNRIENLEITTLEEHGKHHINKYMTDDVRHRISMRIKSEYDAGLRTPARNWVGKKHTEATKKKISESNLGRKLSSEHIQNIKNSWTKERKDNVWNAKIKVGL